jgi:DNA-binding transcriptional regulator YiaG
MRKDNEWDDDDETSDDDESDEYDGVEDEIAARAVLAWDEVEGNHEIAQAAREALVLIAEAALEKKEDRRRREEDVRRRRLARDRADQGARQAREQAERRAAQARAEEQARAARWQAELTAQKARQAAVERAHAQVQGERRVVAPAGPRQRPATPTGAKRTPPAPRPVRRPAPVPAPARVEPPVIAAPADEHDEADATVLTVNGFEAKQADPTPEEPIRFLSLEQSAVLTGADLSAWRARLGLTQQAAADRLGVRQGTVSKAESRGDDVLGPALRDVLRLALDAG